MTDRSAADDVEYCAGALRDVSRTFSKPIEALRPDLSRAVGCAYLLCRIADTVEDHDGLSPRTRDGLFTALLDALEADGSPSVFEERFAPVADARPDHELCANLHRVLRVYRELAPELRGRATPFIAEMIRGMSMYGHRPPGLDGLVALRDLADLERYCYYVAGTVGLLLTELFVHAFGPDLEPRRRRALHKHAEEFGLGLQLVNVLKDVTDDRGRRVSYVPRSLAEDVGVDLERITDAGARADAHRAMAPIFDRARRALAAAFEYVLAIPPREIDVRIFCLLPLFMAVATLDLAEGNDAQLVASTPVKITRAEVHAIVDECTRIGGDDAALRRAWTARTGG